MSRNSFEDLLGPLRDLMGEDMAKRKKDTAMKLQSRVRLVVADVSPNLTTTMDLQIGRFR